MSPRNQALKAMQSQDAATFRAYRAEVLAQESLAKSDLPEGILRSTILPEDTLNGTRLILRYQAGWYLVCTRYQVLARRRVFEVAAKLYESILMGDLGTIGGFVCTKEAV